MDSFSLPPLVDRPARVLVAIGDETLREVVAEALSFRGHVVWHAEELLGLVERIRAAKPDLVLLDTTLEDGAAIELLGDIRMLDPLRLVPVVLFSPLPADEDEVVRGLLAGADDHVDGVGRIRELVARIDVQLRNRRDRDLLRSAQKERSRLLDDALTDPLTGVGNRRAADLALARALLEAETALVMVVDVDHFKRVNDTFGHAAGDEVLRALGRALGRLSRDGDSVARYGGEEFVVVIRDAPERSHRAITERFLLGIRNLRMTGTGPQRITASIGAASWMRAGWSIVPGGPPSAAPPEWDGAAGGQALFQLADRCLYRAKRSGRDAIVLARASLDPDAPDSELVLARPTENAA